MGKEIGNSGHCYVTGRGAFDHNFCLVICKLRYYLATGTTWITRSSGTTNDGNRADSSMVFCYGPKNRCSFGANC